MIPKKILVATDGSPSARAAELFSAGLADMMGECQVTVATVLDSRGANSMVVAFKASTDAEMEAAETLVAEAAKRITDAIHNDKVTVRPVAIEAVSPALGLINEAHSDGTCSLIVMGSRGHGRMAQLVRDSVGSVTTQVLHGAHCPVLIVKG